MGELLGYPNRKAGGNSAMDYHPIQGGVVMVLVSFNHTTHGSFNLVDWTHDFTFFMLY